MKGVKMNNDKKELAIMMGTIIGKLNSIRKLLVAIVCVVSVTLIIVWWIWAYLPY